MILFVGPAGGIGGHPAPLLAILGGLVIVLVPYVVAVIFAARRGRLGTGRDEIRSERGPASSMVSVRVALDWLAEAPTRRSVIVTGDGRHHVSLEPNPAGILMQGSNGECPIGPQDVGLTIADGQARRLLAADLELLVGGQIAPTVATFEYVVGAVQHPEPSSTEPSQRTTPRIVRRLMTPPHDGRAQRPQ